MLAGAASPPGKRMAKVIKDREMPDQVGIIGSGFNTSLWDAVFLNTFLAHARELEDDRFDGGASWDITVIPLVLSFGEKLHLPGKLLLEAMIAGLEVHTRTCILNPGHLGVQIVPGAIGPAVAAAKILGLREEEIASAMGLAMSGVPLAIVNFGTDAHYFESGLHSLQGIMAGEMAKGGMTSNPDIATYLSNLHFGKEKVEPEQIVEELGDRWFLLEIWIKKYPCCFLIHRQVDSLIELRQEHGLNYEDVHLIEVDISPADEPANRPEPKTVGDLQFSFQHSLGCAMYDGELDIIHYTDDAINNPKYIEARSKVKIIPHYDWSRKVLDAPSHITIRTNDGNVYSRERRHVIGSPEEPLSIQQFHDLYSKFSRGVLLDEQIERTADAILNLEKLSDVCELMDTLTFKCTN
jgi:2-methylcitrate dehydratase PrpD